MTNGHASDCAVHNEPAYPAGTCDCKDQVIHLGERVGHLHIIHHQDGTIILAHDSGQAMQTSEDKLYRHLMEYWNKEF